jgi:chemotaxis protein MotB
MLMYTTLMLILVSFFIVLLSKANFDETKYATAVSSIRRNFGSLRGGRVAVGADEGLPDISRGFDEGGRLMLPDTDLAQVRALLAPALLDREARIIRSKNKQIISLSAGLVFNLNSDEISEDLAQTLRVFARLMADNRVPINVEGHTSDLPPMTEGVGDNWDVSSRRALAVMEFLATEGGLAPERLSAFAYAGAKPLYSNATPRGRAGNQRVDLVLDFSEIRSKEVEALAEKARTFNFQGFDFLLRDQPGARP